MFSRSNHSHVEHCKMLQCQCPHLLLGHSSLDRSERVFNVTAKPAYDLAGVAHRQPRGSGEPVRGLRAPSGRRPSSLPPWPASLCARALRSHAHSGPWGPDGPSVAWPRSLPPCPLQLAAKSLSALGRSSSGRARLPGRAPLRSSPSAPASSCGRQGAAAAGGLWGAGGAAPGPCSSIRSASVLPGRACGGAPGPSCTRYF